jgi:hypothetical protein
MPVTPLQTLKARVRREVERAALHSADQLPAVLRKEYDDGRFAFLLSDSLVHDVALMMQKHEEWVAAGRPGINPSNA